MTINNSYNDDLARFRGIATMFGLKGLQKLHNANVTIVGLGGVGSWCTESLARSGIGHMRIIDHDVIAIHNINRQIHSLTSTVGKSKTETLAARLLDINPNLNLTFHKDYIDKNNIDIYFPKENNFNCLVIDAIDSIDSKTFLINHLKRNKYKFISSGGAGGKTDVSKIKYTDLKNATQDALLSKVRYKLRHDYGFTTTGKMGIKTVFIDQAPLSYQSVLSTEEQEVIKQYYDKQNITFGAFMPATASVGLAIAQQIILWILNS